MTTTTAAIARWSGRGGGRTGRAFAAVMLIVAFAMPVVSAVAARPAAAASGNTVYVDAKAPNDPLDCTNPATPCQTLIGGWNQLKAGGTISIAPGTYFIQTDIPTSVNVVGTGSSPGDVVINPSVNPIGLGDYPVFWISNALGKGFPYVNVSNVTITGSTFDSAIVNSGTLTLTNDVITGNASQDPLGTRNAYSSEGEGGAIANEGIYASLILDHTVVSNNTARIGGGIENNGGAVAVSDSTISGNDARVGGGISSGYGTVTISRSAVTGNTASAPITNTGSGRGGGVDSLGDTQLHIANSTIASNRATFVGGGFSADASKVTLVNDTIAKNTVDGYSGATDGVDGGGFALVDRTGGSHLQVENTIVATNNGPVNADCFVDPAVEHSVVEDLGHNIVGNATGCAGFSAASGDQVGTATVPVDARLGALGPNGGPTATFPIDSNSPAFGAGDTTACVSAAVGGVDQRNIARRISTRGVCDIGAYDSGLLAPPAPVGVSAYASFGALNVAWQAPPGYLPAISYYDVTCTPDCGNNYTTNTYLSLTNLTVGQAYTFTVTAVSDAGGQGAPSLPSNVATFATVPGAPRNVVAAANGTTVTLSWDAPAGNSGAAITEYDVFCHPDVTVRGIDGTPINCSAFNPVARPGVLSPLATSVTLYDIPRGSAVRFGVVAGNGVGGSAEALANSVTIASAPGTPTATLDPASDSGPSNRDGITNVDRPTLLGSADAGATVTVLDGATPVGTTTANTTGRWSFVPPAPLAIGAHTITASATNGGTTSTSIPLSVLVDPSAPTAPAVDATAGIGSASVTWNAATDAATGIYEYTVTASPGGATQVVGADTRTATFIGLAPGTAYSFTVIAQNLAGTSGPAGRSNAVAPPLPPSVTKVAPAYGPAGGGTKVTITGSHYTGATAVQFGAVPATSFTVNRAGTQIVAVAPANAGIVDVTVTAAPGTSTPSAADQFSYAPVVTKVSPASGTGGAKVKLIGHNLGDATSVTFDNVAASFTRVSSTKLVATAPVIFRSASFRAYITVNGPGGSSPAFAVPFDYTVPSVSAVAPSSARAGATVTITGKNFVGVTALNFGPTFATTFKVVSPTRITVVVPPGSGTVDVSVINNVGPSDASPTDTFTYA